MLHWFACISRVLFNLYWYIEDQSNWSKGRSFQKHFYLHALWSSAFINAISQKWLLFDCGGSCSLYLFYGVHLFVQLVTITLIRLLMDWLNWSEWCVSHKGIQLNAKQRQRDYRNTAFVYERVTSATATKIFIGSSSRKLLKGNGWKKQAKSFLNLHS